MSDKGTEQDLTPDPAQTPSPAGALKTDTEGDEGQPGQPNRAIPLKYSPTGGEPPQPEPVPEEGRPVPYERFKQLNQRYKEVNERLKALEAERAKEREEREQAERKRLEETQQYKELYEKERAAHEATKSDLLSKLTALRLDVTLRDYLAEKHPNYSAKAKYMRPLIQVPADKAEDEEAVKQAVMEVAEAWVKDNPIPPPTPGAPSNNPPSGAGAGGQPQGDEYWKRRYGIV